MGHLRHVGHAASVPVDDVAVECVATVTESTVPVVHIQAKEVAHICNEGHLQDKIRAGAENQGLALVMGMGVASSIKNWFICGSLHPRR